jgi:hypothetical protein
MSWALRKSQLWHPARRQWLSRRPGRSPRREAEKGHRYAYRSATLRSATQAGTGRSRVLRSKHRSRNSRSHNRRRICRTWSCTRGCRPAGKRPCTRCLPGRCNHRCMARTKQSGETASTREGKVLGRQTISSWLVLRQRTFRMRLAIIDGRPQSGEGKMALVRTILASFPVYSPASHEECAPAFPCESSKREFYDR